MGRVFIRLILVLCVVLPPGAGAFEVSGGVQLGQGIPVATAEGSVGAVHLDGEQAILAYTNAVTLETTVHVFVREGEGWGAGGIGVGSGRGGFAGEG